MRYLRSFEFASVGWEEQFLNDIRRTVYTTFYPLGVLSGKGIDSLEMTPLTILYGENGSGKTTVLNVMAEKVHAERNTLYNRSNFFEDYLKHCDADLASDRPDEIRIITSDDVFDFMLELRHLNEGIDRKREELFEDWVDAKYAHFQLKSLEDYEELKKINAARSHTQSRFVKDRLMGNVREHSNGESAFLYFTEKIRERGLYFLDEPENSMSPERQKELAGFLIDSVRFYDCQIIMATHSPFLLAIPGAVVYNLDEPGAPRQKWSDLPNMRAYYRLFEEHREAFESPSG